MSSDRDFIGGTHQQQLIVSAKKIELGRADCVAVKSFPRPAMEKSSRLSEKAKETNQQLSLSLFLRPRLVLIAMEHQSEN